jgi:4'-phosphopantetheinyl transferase
MVKVFVAQNTIRWEQSVYAAVANQLPIFFLEKASKFRRWQDAQALLIGKLLLKIGLKEYGAQELLIEDIQYNAFHRPYIKTDIDFNISHAGEYVVCVLSKECRVGIDIEQIHEVNIEHFVDCFTSHELEKLSRSSEFLRDFFVTWTIKEAVIKADGRGLQIPLNQISASQQVALGDTCWYVIQLEIAGGYVAHLATNKIVEAPIKIQHVCVI